MRIVPLNKIAPRMAEIKNMRPIIVMSHFTKYIEYQYLDKLKEWVQNYIDPVQTGFVHKLGTQVQVIKLVNELQIKGKNKAVIFFDFSNAYNTIDRQKLKSIMMEFQKDIKQEIIKQQNLDFLFDLYDNMQFYDPIEKKKVHIKNGVHQGSMLSPLLFDIYMDKMIEEFKGQCRKVQQIEYIKKKTNKSRQLNNRIWEQNQFFAYADDVAIVTNKTIAGRVCSIFNEVSDKFNLQMNSQKSYYMCRSEIKELDQLGIQKIKKFRYLGYQINIKGNLNEHLKQIKSQVLNAAIRIRRLIKVIPIRQIFVIWKQFVDSIFNYQKEIIWLQTPQTKRQLEALRRQSLKMSLSLPRSTPSIIIDAIIGVLNRSKSIEHMIIYQRKREQQYNTYRHFKEFYIKFLQGQNTIYKEIYMDYDTKKNIQFNSQNIKDFNAAKWDQNIINKMNQRELNQAQRIYNKFYKKGDYELEVNQVVTKYTYFFWLDMTEYNGKQSKLLEIFQENTDKQIEEMKRNKYNEFMGCMDERWDIDEEKEKQLYERYRNFYLQEEEWRHRGFGDAMERWIFSNTRLLEFNTQATRRIPGLNFFNIFKFAQYKCLQHKTHLTYKHIISHSDELKVKWKEMFVYIFKKKYGEPHFNRKKWDLMKWKLKACTKLLRETMLEIVSEKDRQIIVNMI